MADANSSSFIPQSGMTEDHFKIFQNVAQEQKVAVMVRLTNTQSTDLIKKGCPGKPLTIKFHTSESTGVVTAASPAEVDLARKSGYLVVEPGSQVARGTMIQNGRQVEQEMKIQNPFWRVEPGQLIDPKVRKPLVGDYDLMGVFSPESPGRLLGLAASEGRALDDVSNPIVERYRARVNALLDMPRVHHGPQELYQGYRGGAILLLPDGQAHLLPDEATVKEFYDWIGRKTRIEEFPRPPSSLPVVSGSRLVRRAGKGVLQNQDAMAMLGVSLGLAIQWFGDVVTRQQFQRELQIKHGAAISGHLNRGDGVLVIARMQEWALPDFNGMRARGLLGVYIEPGKTQDEALANWRKPKLVKEPPFGWRAYENYVWIDPNY